MVIVVTCTELIITFLQALCHSFPGRPTCLAFDAKNKHIAIGFDNGKVSVYPKQSIFFSLTLYPNTCRMHRGVANGPAGSVSAGPFFTKHCTYFAVKSHQFCCVASDQTLRALLVNHSLLSRGKE